MMKKVQDLHYISRKATEPMIPSFPTNNISKQIRFAFFVYPRQKKYLRHLENLWTYPPVLRRGAIYQS